MNCDGFRAIWYVEDGRCNLVSQRGNVLTRFDALGEQVASARSGSFGAVLRDQLHEAVVIVGLLSGAPGSADSPSNHLCVVGVAPTGAACENDAVFVLPSDLVTVQATVQFFVSGLEVAYTAEGLYK
jgi:hypothetical protein